MLLHKSDTSGHFDLKKFSTRPKIYFVMYPIIVI